MYFSRYIGHIFPTTVLLLFLSMFNDILCVPVQLINNCYCCNDLVIHIICLQSSQVINSEVITWEV